MVDHHPMSLGHQLDLSPTAVLAVVLTTAVMYLGLVVLLRLWGARLLANPASHTMATVVVLGAIVGRASLGLEPDLEAGVLALGTVLLLMQLVGRAIERGARRPAEPLVVAGCVQADTLHRLRLTEADLWSRLRHAGVGRLSDASLVLVEPNGELSVFRGGEALERAAVRDVRGSEAFPPDLFS
jgi:uncharacterized membrane protein YcaP (DUF421 family)